jgi:ABC-type multidrug transport system fused ATPase/permease subunit
LPKRSFISFEYFQLQHVGGPNSFEFYLSLIFLRRRLIGAQSCETKMAVHKLLQPTHFGVEDLNYIKRKEYEIRLNQIIRNLNQEKYVIIVGSKGSGKTTFKAFSMEKKELFL